MNPTRFRWLALLLAMLVLAAWLAWPAAPPAPAVATAAADCPPGQADCGAAPTEERRPATASISAEPALGLPVSVRRSAPPVAPTAPLPAAALPPPPAADVALAEALPALEARAAAGDREAASRLAQDALCCAALDQMAAMLDSLRRGPQGNVASVPPQFAANLRQREAEFVALGQHCGAVPRLTPARVFDYALRAAELGDPVATLDLVANPQVLMPLQMRALAEPERLASFRERALPLLLREVGRGNLDAVRVLAAAHATPDRHPIGALVEQDLAISLVYDLLYLRAGGQAHRQQFEAFVQRSRAELEPARYADAEAQAEQLYQRHFGGRSGSESARPLLPGMAPSPEFQMAPALAAQRRSCPRSGRDGMAMPQAPVAPPRPPG